MSALVGYLALGTLDPVTSVFTETTYAGYARQAVAFDLDVPGSGGAVGSGAPTMRSNAALVFPVPTAVDWPSLNAYAVFPAISGGVPVIMTSLGARSGINQRGTARTFDVGTFALSVDAGRVNSSLGGVVAVQGAALLTNGVLTFLSSNTTGAGAPTTAPTSVGLLYFDLTNRKVYASMATTAASDWVILN